MTELCELAFGPVPKYCSRSNGCCPEPSNGGKWPGHTADLPSLNGSKRDIVAIEPTQRDSPLKLASPATMAPPLIGCAVILAIWRGNFSAVPIPWSRARRDACRPALGSP